jgi:hypothetical protein
MRRPRCTLLELLAASDYSLARPLEERDGLMRQPSAGEMNVCVMDHEHNPCP